MEDSRSTIPSVAPPPVREHEVPAGARLTLPVDYQNASPEIAEFYAEVEGLHAEWVQGAGRPAARTTPAGGGDAFPLVLAPPRGAQPGTYAFSVAIRDQDDFTVAGHQGVLQVRPPEREEHRALPAGQEHLALPASPELAALPPSAPERTSLAPMVESRALPPGQSSAALLFPDALVTPTAERFIQELEPDTETTTFGVPGDEAPDDEPVEDEEFIADPGDGCEFRLYPGGRLLIKIWVENSWARERTFVLDDDGALGPDWLNLVLDQASLERGGQEYLTFRLHPPEGAAPGRYPFSIMFGPEGTPFTRKAFALVVPGVPVVQLWSEEKLLRLRPFPGREAVFHLKAKNVGNVDSAIRLHLKDYSGDASDPVEDECTSSIETRRCRVWFNREIGTVRAPTRPNTDGVGDEFRLHVRRKSRWWWGRSETIKVTAYAVPVTNPSNQFPAGSTRPPESNQVELTLVRSRLAPVPNTALGILVALVLTFGLSFVSDPSLTLISAGQSDTPIDSARGKVHYTWHVPETDDGAKAPSQGAVLESWTLADTSNRIWVGVPLPAEARARKAIPGTTGASSAAGDDLPSLRLRWSAGPLFPVHWLLNRSDTENATDGDGWLFNRKSLDLRIRSVAPDPAYRQPKVLIGRRPEVLDVFGPSDLPSGWHSITRSLEVNTSFGAPGFERQYYLWFVYFRREERLKVYREHLGTDHDPTPVYFHPTPHTGTEQITTYEVPVRPDGSNAVVWLQNVSPGRDINYWLVKPLGSTSRFSLGYLNEDGMLEGGGRRQLVFNLPKPKGGTGASAAEPANQSGTKSGSVSLAESDYEDPDTVVLASTDAEHGLFRFRLRLAKEGER